MMMGTQLPETCREVEKIYTKKMRAPSWLRLKRIIQDGRSTKHKIPHGDHSNLGSKHHTQISIMVLYMWPTIIYICLSVYDSPCSRGSSVGLATTLRAGQSGIQIQARVRDVSLRRNVRTGSGAHPASYSISTGVFLRGNAAGAWSWLFT